MNGKNNGSAILSWRSLRSGAAAFFYAFVACNVLLALAHRMAGSAGGYKYSKSLSICSHSYQQSFLFLYHIFSLFTDPSEVTSPRDAINLVVVASNLTSAADEEGGGDNRNAKFLSTFLVRVKENYKKSAQPTQKQFCKPPPEAVLKSFFT